MTVDSLTFSAQIPDHTLLRVIGRGSYGEVWLARNVMGTLRAVKIVRRSAFDSDRPWMREFEGIRRCEPVSRAHDGLIDILHMGRNEEDGFFYYVMELADAAGGSEEYAPATLAARLSSGRALEMPDCLRLTESLAGALAFLHEQGLIHRDVKPSNVLYAGGVPKLGDIGLVAEAGSSRSFVGTEGFVPLEGPGTERADIFALGKVVYEALTGLDRERFPRLPPWWADDAEFDQRVELNEIVLRACEGDPARRYHTAREMLADVAILASGRSVKKFRVMERRLHWLKWAAVLTVILVLLSGGTAWLLQRERTRTEALEQAQRDQTKAAQQAEEVSRQLADALDTAELDRVEYLFRSGESADALGLLARIVQRNPEHRTAVPRLALALWHGNFAMPVLPPFTTGGYVLKMQFLRDGKTLLILHRRGLATWDAATGRQLVKFDPVEGELSHAVLSPDENTLIAWNDRSGGTLRIFDMKTGKLRAGPFPHPGWLHTVGFSPNGSQFIAAGDGPEIRIFNSTTGVRSEISMVHPPKQWAAVFDPTGGRIATCATDTIRIWDAVTHRLQRELPAAGILLLEYSPDGRWIFAACADGTMRLFSANDDTPPAVMKHAERVRFAAFSADSKRLVTASSDHTARVWAVPGAEPLTPPLRHRDAVNFAAFSPDGTRVVTCATDHTARVWDATAGRVLSQPLYHNEQPLAAAFAPDGTTLYTSGADSIVRRWMLRGPSALPADHSTPPSAPSAASRVSPDGRFTFTLNANKRSAVLSGPAGIVQIGGLTTNSDKFTSAEFSPDSTLLVTGSTDKAARVWDAMTGAAVMSVQHMRTVAAVAFSPDSQRLATASWDGTARVWDARTGAPRARPLGHEGHVLDVKFSPDGRRLATASRDRTIRLWDAESGQPLSEPLPHGAPAEQVNFDPGGQRITVLAGGHEWVWDVPDFPPPPPPWLAELAETVSLSEPPANALELFAFIARYEKTRGAALAGKDSAYARLARRIFQNEDPEQPH
jgi:WD40 repeat protein